MNFICLYLLNKLILEFTSNYYIYTILYHNYDPNAEKQYVTSSCFTEGL